MSNVPPGTQTMPLRAPLVSPPAEEVFGIISIAKLRSIESTLLSVTPTTPERSKLSRLATLCALLCYRKSTATKLISFDKTFYVDAALVGCGHVSGRLMRHGWPQLCADQVLITGIEVAKHAGGQQPAPGRKSYRL